MSNPRRILSLVIALALLVSACATFKALPPRERTRVILMDALWGIRAACDQQWLPPNACTLAEDAFGAAVGIAEKNPADSREQIIALLTDLDRTLPNTQNIPRLHDYLRVAVRVLNGGK